MGSHASEMAAGERFAFGENWSQLLPRLDDARVFRAEASLKEMLEVDHLHGASFLDIGSGSGLFSLAARRLGARVHSFDYDPQAVACTWQLRRRYLPDDERWTIEEGSVLDREYLARLGTFDVVYSWGVLHHTGHLWDALENAHRSVAPGGKLFIAIYNDVGTRSVRWRAIKRTYNRLPRLLRFPFALLVKMPSESRDALRALLTFRIGSYVQSWVQPNPERGMDRWRDIIDWVGGYPYEVAKPEELFDFYRARHFTLTRLKCGNVGLGCNEFVFQKGRTH